MEKDGNMPKTVLEKALEVCEPDVHTRGLVREMLTRVGDKWTMLVVQSLAESPLRFSALRDTIPGISHRMLTVTLRALERDGLVTRVSHPEVPPRVEYSLTPLGDTLLPAVMTLVAWVQEHRDEVESSRAVYGGAVSREFVRSA
jgi:DNA-binding HxlR family transcriptional regulator